jgi:hypothetical protein
MILKASYHFAKTSSKKKVPSGDLYMMSRVPMRERQIREHERRPILGPSQSSAVRVHCPHVRTGVSFS